MPSKLLLDCTGMDLGTISVPAFQVILGEVVAIVHPVEDGDDSINLMSFLSGLGASQVIAHCETALVHPFLCYSKYEGMIDRPLPDFFRANGLTASEAYEVIAAAGLQPDLTYGNVQLTNRLLLEMKMCLLRGVQLMVLSTGGLDPLGKGRVLSEARKNKTQCSSLALIQDVHDNLASYQASTGLFDRLLHIKKRQDASTTGKKRGRSSF